MSAQGFGPQGFGLFDPAQEKDSCGVGFIADIKGRKSHKIVEDALTILLNLEHRGAVGADPRAGDGAGILLQIPHKFFSKKARELGFTLPAAGPLCRRRAVPAARRRVARRDHGHLRGGRRARRHGAPRLARRADRQFDARRNGQADRAPAHAGVSGARRKDRVGGRVRAAALHPAQDHLARALFAARALDLALLSGVDLLPDPDLQGHVPRRSARHLLSGLARPGFRERARFGASALFDQHLPDLVAGASLPHGRP